MKIENIYCRQSPLTMKGITVQIRVEWIDSTIVPVTEVTMPAVHKTFEEYGIHDQWDPGFDTPVHVVAQYLMDEWGTSPQEMRTMLDLKNDNLSKICGIYADESDSVFASRYWMYMINDKFPSPEGSRRGYHMIEYPLKNGDAITIYVVQYLETNYYGYFQQHQFDAKKGEIVNLTLLGRNILGGDSFPLSNVTLLTSDREKALTTTTNITTDFQGKASICFHASGTYVLSAKREDTSRAYAEVMVAAT